MTKCGQIAIEFYLLVGLLQGEADFPGHTLARFQELRKASILLDPLRCCLLPHSRYSGEVIARVAAESGVIGVLQRSESILLFQRIRRHAHQIADTLAWIEHGGVIINQLEGVAIARRDHDLHGMCVGLRLQSRNDVVGLEPRNGDGLHIKRR
ncbi:unannotated protein [freshwater metagenome]|uniref:Unannotated protein n=1 Tax=freshwater metagenome TaxID=449393 RepID=A0A6J7VHJ7_9ZZZZ